MYKAIRPWGYYEVILSAPNYKIKRIIVHPGMRTSLQRHRRRAEHWFIICGKAIINFNDQTLLLDTGQSVDIPCGTPHRIKNPGPESLLLIEIQTGSYFGEDDIERVEDDYGRI